jgi:hypothetical protein
MAPTVTIQTAKGTRTLPTVWQGENLSVHRPPSSKSPTGLSQKPRHWAITHTASGLAACAGFDGTKTAAVNLARLWDAAFGTINPQDARNWCYRETWKHDVRLAQWEGTERPNGPILPDYPTTADVAAAMAAAVGATFEPTTEAEAAEPFPVAEVLAPSRWRNGTDGPEVFWRGRWWPAPTIGEVELWAFDSTAETPDGRTVEPDHPEAWTRILGMV